MDNWVIKTLMLLQAYSGAIAALATVVIAFFTAMLFFVTNNQVKAARTAAEAAQKSAEVSEKALIDLEGPFLYPVIEATEFWKQVSQGDSLVESNPSYILPSIEIWIKNIGRSTGFPALLSCAFYIGTGDEPPADPRGGFFAESMIGAGNISETFIQRELPSPTTARECSLIKQGAVILFIKGYIAFVDMFGNEYVQEFCLKGAPSTKKFMAWGPSRNQRKRIRSK